MEPIVGIDPNQMGVEGGMVDFRQRNAVSDNRLTQQFVLVCDDVRGIEQHRFGKTDTDASCLRLIDSKEGVSVRPIGIPVVEFLETQRKTRTGSYVFPGYGEDNAFGGFPNHWRQLFRDSPLSDITPHVLRHSFASIGNDLGFTEVTIAALIGHAKGSVTSEYIHTLDTALIMAADTVGYIQGLLDGKEFKQTAYALDRDSRKAALTRFLLKASGENENAEATEDQRLAA